MTGPWAGRPDVGRVGLLDVDRVVTLDVVPDLLFVMGEHDAPPGDHEHARADSSPLETPPVRCGTLSLPTVGNEDRSAACLGAAGVRSADDTAPGTRAHPSIR